MKISVFTAVCLAAVMILTACQPTPEAPAVVGKQDYASYEKTEEFEAITVPEHVMETYDQFPRLIISIDAEVRMPDATAYPIVEVTKKIFTQEEQLGIIKGLSGSDKLYSEYQASQGDWVREIAIAKENLKKEGASDNYIESLNTYIDIAQEHLEKAPEQAQATPLDISKLEEGKDYDVYIIKENGSVCKSTFGQGVNMFYYLRDNHEHAMPQRAVAPGYDDELWHKPGEPEIDEETARRTAQECMKQMGGDLTYLSSEPCAVSTAKGTLTTGWQVMFTREISGLQKLSLSSSYINPEALPSYGSPWGEEVFTAVVDKDGVCQLEYKGASKLDKTVIESTELKDFESIKERAVEQLNYMYAAHENEKGKGLDIKITKFELGTDMLSVEDRDDIGQYIPTWRVTFESKWQDSDEIPNNNIIFFNAVDGSYIEPRITNTELMEIMKN